MNPKILPKLFIFIAIFSIVSLGLWQVSEARINNPTSVAGGSFSFQSITSTNANFTNLTWTNATGTNLSTTNFNPTNITVTNVTTTNLAVTGQEAWTSMSSSSVPYVGPNGVIAGNSTTLSFTGQKLGINNNLPSGLLDIVNVSSTYAIRVASSTGVGAVVFAVSSTPGSPNIMSVGVQGGTGSTNPGMFLNNQVQLNADSNGGMNIVVPGVTAVFRLSPFQNDIYFDNRATGGQFFRVNTDGSTLTPLTMTTGGLVGINSTTPRTTFAITGRPGGSNVLLITSSTNAEFLRLDTLGNFGINSSSPQAKLANQGTLLNVGDATSTGNFALSGIGAPASSGDIVCYVSGAITHQATNCTVSSARFKENIKALSPEKLLAEVQALRAVSFDFRDGFVPTTGKESTGFIAEEVAQIDPQLVIYTSKYTTEDLKFVQKNYPKAILIKDGKTLIPQTVDYARVSVLLVGSEQALLERIEKLEAKVSGFQSFWQELKSLISKWF